MYNQKNTAIILLNWNSYNDTFECLKSLENIKGASFHIFLADNCSTDYSFKRLLEDYEHKVFNLPITFIQTGSNLGFAGGNNIAIRQAHALGYDFFWMLNNDTIVKEDTLTNLLSVISDSDDIAIVGSKILYFNTNKIWFAGGKVNLYTGDVKHIGIMEDDKGQYNEIKEVDYITGCSLLFRRNLVMEIGLMNEEYFLYYEETEWNLRARNNRYKIKYVPNSVVYHKVSSSSGGVSNIAPYVSYYNIRNSFTMIKRTQSKLNSTFAGINVLVKMVKELIKLIIRRQDNSLERLFYIFTGVKDAYFGKMGKHPVYISKKN